MQEGGVADILCCWNGLFVAIEVKVPGEEPSNLQEYHIQQVQNARGYSFCAHSLKEVRTALREIESSILAKMGL